MAYQGFTGILQIKDCQSIIIVVIMLGSLSHHCNHHNRIVITRITRSLKMHIYNLRWLAKLNFKVLKILMRSFSLNHHDNYNPHHQSKGGGGLWVPWAAAVWQILDPGSHLLMQIKFSCFLRTVTKIIIHKTLFTLSLASSWPRFSPPHTNQILLFLENSD